MGVSPLTSLNFLMLQFVPHQPINWLDGSVMEYLVNPNPLRDIRISWYRYLVGLIPVSDVAARNTC